MLTYDWDGNPLPVDHGFPLRVWIPDRYGMKQPKWITSIEVVDEYQEGYWVARGWDEIAQVKTTSAASWRPPPPPPIKLVRASPITKTNISNTPKTISSMY